MVKLIKKYKIIIILFGLGIFNILGLYLIGYECPWKKNFNIDCAGCGATRMLISIFHLEFYQAFRYNPLMFSLLLLSIIYFVYIIIFKIIGKDYFRIHRNSLWLLLILTIIFTVIRNIPGFEYLKPTKIN